jgi:S-adenosylmethionine hydrolase
LDLNGNESTSMSPVDVGTGTREEKVAPKKVGVEDWFVKPDGGYAMRLSTMRFVKKAVMIAKSLDTKW